MVTVFQKRIKRIRRYFEQQRESSAMLVSSAPARIRSRDTCYDYRQDSDFFYLTGIKCRGLSLLISSAIREPILFAPKVSAHEILWEGRPANFAELAEALGARLIISRDIRTDILTHLKSIKNLYYQNVPQSQAWGVTKYIMGLSSSERGTLPSRCHHLDAVLAEMRLYKDETEIQTIKRAAKITAESLHKVAQLIRPGNSEGEIAATIDYWFRMQHATSGFNTIVGAGPNAATLHYTALTRELIDGELLLVDCGAEYELYSADISRVFPINGVFDEMQAELYAIVLAAQRAAISKVRDGVTIKSVFDAAVREITTGLKEVGVLRGKVSNLIARQAYKPFFPHSIGHSLGLDVHDVTSDGQRSEGILKRGMVITIEPGLYFSKRVRRIKPCGFRIEDDVLVTRNGSEVLTPYFPKEIAEVESLLR